MRNLCLQRHIRCLRLHPGGARRRQSALVVQSFVDGSSLPSSGSAAGAIVQPSTGEQLGDFEVAGRAEVDAAVASAKVAQKEWLRMKPLDRARVLRHAADLLEDSRAQLERLECVDTGRPIVEMSSDVTAARDCLEFFAGVLPTMAGRQVDYGAAVGGSFAYTRREPLGVCAGIGAWNYPLQGAAWKLGPALCGGNALVYKPAEDTCLTTLQLAQVMVEAGAPRGLFNVVLGAKETGQLLTGHPDIAKISFTGEAATGKAICADAAKTLKRVTMELGGKSPLIVFEDADLDNAVRAAMMANWYSCGQVCSNGTRVFVQHGIKEAFLEKLLLRTRLLQIGDPLDPSTHVGAVISRRHLDRVLDYVAQGEEEGGRVLAGSSRPYMPADPALRGGSYAAPVILDGCKDDNIVVREEIFGPVMAVLDFRDEDEVVKRANATRFGLSAGIFTQSLNRAHRVAARLEAGTTWINNYNLAPAELPWGGLNPSGSKWARSRRSTQMATSPLKACLRSNYQPLAIRTTPTSAGDVENQLLLCTIDRTNAGRWLGDPAPDLGPRRQTLAKQDSTLLLLRLLVGGILGRSLPHLEDAVSNLIEAETWVLFAKDGCLPFQEQVERHLHIGVRARRVAKDVDGRIDAAGALALVLSVGVLDLVVFLGSKAQSGKLGFGFFLRLLALLLCHTCRRFLLLLQLRIARPLPPRLALRPRVQHRLQVIQPSPTTPAASPATSTATAPTAPTAPTCRLGSPGLSPGFRRGVVRGILLRFYRRLLAAKAISFRFLLLPVLVSLGGSPVGAPGPLLRLRCFLLRGLLRCALGCLLGS
eukprot:scaffold870_cov268-Pinguiococcus_pyrenoidosus.AAC.70